MNTVEDVLECLNSADGELQVSALQVLIQTPTLAENIEVQERVEELTQTGEIAVKFWSRKLLTKLPSQSAKSKGQIEETVAYPADVPLSVDLFFQKLQSVKSSYVAIDVIKKILDSKDPSAKQGLVAFLENSHDPIVISFLTKNLGIYFPDEDLLPILGKYLSHPDDRIAANTIEGVENIESPKTIVLISQVLEHKHHRVRANAAKALAKQDPVISNQVITKMLSMHERPHFVIAAMYAVKALKDKRFLGTLKELTTHPILGETAQEVMLSFSEIQAVPAKSTSRGNSAIVPGAPPVGKGAEGASPSPESNQGTTDQVEGIPPFLLPILRPFGTLFNQGKSFFLEGFLPLFKSTWKWTFRFLGVGLAIGFIYLITIMGGKLYALKPQPVQIPEWERGISAEQRSFIQALEELSRGYTETTNKLRRSTYFETIQRKLQGTMTSVEFKDWIGEVHSLECGNLEKVVVEIKLAAPELTILIGNWALDSVKFESNLRGNRTEVNPKTKESENLWIPKDSLLFQTLTSLEIMQKVKISGKFIKSDVGYLTLVFSASSNAETAAGDAITKPRLLVRFTSIQKL